MKKFRILNIKALLLLLAALVVFGVLIFILFPKNQDNAITLELENLKKINENYQYDNFAWDSSIDDVSKKIDLKLAEEIPDPQVKDGPALEADFKPAEPFELDGQPGSATFGFEKDQLKYIMFDFALGEKDQSWCEQQAARLIELHGEASEIIQVSNKTYTREGYKWETDTTILEIYYRQLHTSVSSAAEEQALVITVYVKEAPPEALLLDLSNIKKTDRNFQYKDIKLDMSLDDTIQKLGFEMIEDDSMYQGAFADTHNIYKSVQQFELDGQYAEASIAFFDDQPDKPLREIWFEFRSVKDENHKIWFEEQAAYLIELHGEPSEKDEVTNEVLTTVQYTWDADDTRLWFFSTIRTGSENNSPFISIGITEIPQ